MIKHPSVVRLYETLETDNSYYLVMELCLGRDLLDRICDKGRQILSAVEHLHCQGIVHREFKQTKKKPHQKINSRDFTHLIQADISALLVP
uniref:non-specific serine/threonine protein kinase n=1 Tax=Falco tinnunculus TaxID=100819 RepID=A0A8C4TUK1_FALTI